MSDICPVCEKEIGFWRIDLGGVLVHSGCEATYLKDPEIFGGGAKTETLTKNEKEAVEQRKQRINEHQQKFEDQSVHVKSFDMPFGDMVGFMVKWALASIPAFFILAIIGAIFFAIFGAFFF